ncbi:unnamed protein product [Symbiodinium sp. KB8]|nr:unnamed protein product [Symbiodinium sp. KB8]
MDQAMAASKYTYVQYYDMHKYSKITEGEHSIQDLPLVDSLLAKGKKLKEFFHVVKNVSASDYQTIVETMNSDPNCIGRLPDSVRPRDALGDQCKLQIVIWPNQDNDTYTVLKFFHSRVPVPLGLAKAFCAQEVKVLNYAVSDNSDLLKQAFLYLLSRIPDEMWMTQAGIEHINTHAPLANAKNEQFLWSLLNIRDKDSPICGWPLHVVGKACGNRATGNSQSDPEYFFPLLLRDLNSEFQRTVAPMILPTLLSFGLIILGKARHRKDSCSDHHGHGRGSLPDTGRRGCDERYSFSSGEASNSETKFVSSSTNRSKSWYLVCRIGASFKAGWNIAKNCFQVIIACIHQTILAHVQELFDIFDIDGGKERIVQDDRDVIDMDDPDAEPLSPEYDA